MSNALLLRRRGMMAKEAVLPDGQLEWIETDGTAYIQTNIAAKFVSSSRIKAKLSEIQGHQLICGNVVGNDVYLAYVGMWWSGANPMITTLRRFFMNGIPYTHGFAEPIEIEHQWGSANSTVFIVKRNGVVLDTFSYTNNIQNVNNNYAMYIFGARHYNGGYNYGNKDGMRIYEIQLYNGGNFDTEEFHGVPWRLNGEVGLMDTLTNTFYGNAAGSGAFTGGPNVI